LGGTQRIGVDEKRGSNASSGLIDVRGSDPRRFTRRGRSLAVFMMQNALPKLNDFVKVLKLNATRESLVIRMITAFIVHRGRMSASQAADAVRVEPRHRAQLGRFLGRKFWKGVQILSRLRELVFVLSAPEGTYLFILDQTYCSQQGMRAENTFRMGAKSSKKKAKSKRKSGYVLAQKQCHCFVAGLLITGQGIRIPFVKHYYTKDYCQKRGLEYRRQTELAADLIRDLPLPTGADVFVLGDTAFDAESIQSACKDRQFAWIVPMNPERVLAGPKPRPRVWSLASEFSADQFKPIRLHPGSGQFAVQRRASQYRVGPKAKCRTFYVHQERREVQSVGNVRLVFSTKTRPQRGRTVDVQKVLMTNDQTSAVDKIVELYDLRWQIELFFKELKSTLGFHHYRFRRFACVERWVELALAAFLYLEWYRALQLRRRLPQKEKRWWEHKRTFGMCHAIRQIAERDELRLLAKQLRTPHGVRKLAEIVNKSCQKEFRMRM
jgi:DDE family transposase